MSNTINYDVIEKMYLNGELTQGEWGYLTAIDNENYMQNFLTGGPSYKIKYDSTVPEDLYFTNIDEVFYGIYSIFKKYPQLEVDKRFYNSLNILSNNPYKLYEFLTLIAYQVDKEEKKVSPFHIDAISLLKNCKSNLKKYSGVLKKNKEYVGEHREGGQMDAIKEYNEEFKRMLNYDVISDDEDNKKNSL